MKKNISINISGIIFHIEEDGYEKLNNYLESISKYFSSFDDSGEIVADIESRIAEIFLSKLNEGKQVITAEDVEALITTMGSIKDFQAVEDSETDAQPGVGSESESATESGPASTSKSVPDPSSASAGQERSETESGQTKKLYRDENKKLLGGVCAGIAHYFYLDPLWIRLLFIVLASDVFFSHTLGSLIIVVYFFLWIFLPGSADLKEDKNTKKMYRNPDDRVLGGVASGVAAYFGTESTVIRLLFVLVTLFAGTGLLIYIVLWIILPEATSITDKVEMTGDPVTLENIESNIKRGLNVDESEQEESTIVKILLFPFRLLATIIKGIARMLGPFLRFLFDAARIFLGLILILVSISIIFSLLVSLGALLGLLSAGGYMAFWDFPYQLVNEAFPGWTIVLAFVASFVPALAIMFLGLSAIARRSVVTASIGWTLFGIWIFSLLALSFSVPKIVYQFRTDGEYEQTENYSINAETVRIALNETGLDDYEVTDLTIRGHADPEFRLVQEFSAVGSSRMVAIENARMVDYNVEVKDSTIWFDSNLSFDSDAKFRFQELNMTLYIPYGQLFTMDREIRHIITYYSLSRHGYGYSDLDDNVWVFNPSGLECVSCQEEDRTSRRSEDYRREYRESTSIRGYYDEYDFVEFDRIEISGAFDARIVQGSEFKIVVNGRKELIENVDVNQEDSVVRFEADDEVIGRRSNNEMRIIITMPTISSLRLSGATKAVVRGFDENKIEFYLTGASEADVDVDAYDIEVDLSGASKLTIAGNGHELSADLAAASILDAYDFRVDDASVNASVAASAKVYVKENLEINRSMGSNIKYRGGADVTVNGRRN